MPVAVKRIYEKPARSDGTRVLVDRLWPRGVKKSATALDAWLRDLAPSDELRQWFHARPDGWVAFRKRYLMELNNAEAADALAKLYHLAAGRKKLTLLFAAKDEQHNNAVVLKDLLEGMRKPPTGTGPGAAGKARQPKVMRMRR
jgi:uncharacterized protein YeaO (DUF488 family)